MDKYYLTRLAKTNLAAGELQAKLVELQYSRQPPSLGIVYLSHESLADDNEQINRTNTSRASGSLVLNLLALQLRGDKNAAHFTNLRKLGLSIENFVYFDTCKTVELDLSVDRTQVILLGVDSTLFAINLQRTDETGVKKLTDDSERAQLAKHGLPLQCKLQAQSNEQSDSQSLVDFILVLHEKRYSIHKLSPPSLNGQQRLELIDEYLLNNTEAPFLRFTRLINVDVNPNIVIIELNDFSLRVVQCGNLLADFRLSQNAYYPTSNQLQCNQHLVLTCGSQPNEFLLISLTQRQLVAHSIQVTEATDRAHKQVEDPDNLLEREPSFELDKCWSLDLNEIDGIRLLDDDQGPNGAAMCPMWSPSQLNTTSCWSKFMVLLYGSYVLIYSFAQPPTIPFSVVYDRSFLKVKPFNEDPKLRADETVDQDYLDVRTKPKLLHNFKLTGNQRADSLFNSLFVRHQNWQCNFFESRHFSQLGLLIGITTEADVIGLKFNSPKIACQKDNVYQQLIGDALKGDSLLVDLLKKLQQETDAMLVEVDKMENSDFTRDKISLDNFLSVTLQPNKEVGCLYDIVIQISNDMVRVTRIIILSTVTSYIFETASQGSQSVILTTVHNGDTDTQTSRGFEKAFVLSSINLDENWSTNLEELLQKDYLDAEPIQSWAILDLNSQTARTLRLPIFLMNGQHGHLRVLFQFGDLSVMNLVRSETHLLPQDELKTKQVSYLKSLEIKPLMNYQVVSTTNTTTSDLMAKVEITGSFGDLIIARWLLECFDLPDLTLEAKLRSTFTYCSLEFIATRGRLTLISDDLIALEQVKKHLLKRATDSSLKLDISQPTTTLKQLRHLLELQYNNLGIADKLLDQAKESETDSGTETTEGLLDCLMGELLQPGSLPVEMDVPSSHWFHEAFTEDLKRLLKTHESSNQTKTSVNEQIPYQNLIFRDIVIGFIIDLLVDYDRLQGLNSSNKMMLSMRHKIAKLIAPEERLSCKNKVEFVERVLSEWLECRNDCFIK